MSGWKRSWLIAPARSLNTGLGAGGTTSSLSGATAPDAPFPAGTALEPNSGSTSFGTAGKETPGAGRARRSLAGAPAPDAPFPAGTALEPNWGSPSFGTAGKETPGPGRW